MSVTQHRTKCRFGRPHNWTTALAAALNSNIETDLPAEPEWVWWCSTCDEIGPWEVSRTPVTPITPIPSGG